MRVICCFKFSRLFRVLVRRGDEEAPFETLDATFEAILELDKG
jgi:hypothetical protein